MAKTEDTRTVEEVRRDDAAKTSCRVRVMMPRLKGPDTWEYSDPYTHQMGPVKAQNEVDRWKNRGYRAEVVFPGERIPRRVLLAEKLRRQYDVQFKDANLGDETAVSQNQLPGVKS